MRQSAHANELAATPMNVAQLAPGTIVGVDYRVVRPLSEGGMGAVYIADQLSTGKQRALKVMHPQLMGDEKSRERFVQEARVGAQIESDHVVEVVGAGIDATSSAPWLAMELLKGETLDALIHRNGPLAPAMAREILGQLLHAIGAAHTASIVHRDLKPENIFLELPRREGATVTVKVLDFGIAKLVSEAAQITKHTAAIGTPLWMAPEQTEHRGVVTPATDVWAIGLIAFYLLTARIYWNQANIEGATTMSLLREVCFDPIEPASVRAGRYGRTLPLGFDALFLRCVVRDPSARVRDARELRAVLDAAFADVAPMPPSTTPTLASLANAPPESAIGSAATRPYQAPTPQNRYAETIQQGPSPAAAPTMPIAATTMTPIAAATMSPFAAAPMTPMVPIAVEPQRRSAGPIILAAVVAILALAGGAIALLGGKGGRGAPAKHEHTEPEAHEAPLARLLALSATDPIAAYTEARWIEHDPHDRDFEKIANAWATKRLEDLASEPDVEKKKAGLQEIASTPEVSAALRTKASDALDSIAAVASSSSSAAPSTPATPPAAATIGTPKPPPTTPKASANNTAKVLGGSANVEGRLPPEVIRRIVHANFPRFRACYESALAINPALDGSVTTHFVIDATGGVSAASSAGSTMPGAMTGCVIGVFKSLSYPAPDGGIVNVTFPLVFTLD